MSFSGCDKVEIWLSDGDVDYRWTVVRGEDRAGRFEILGRESGGTADSKRLIDWLNDLFKRSTGDGPATSLLLDAASSASLPEPCQVFHDAAHPSRLMLRMPVEAGVTGLLVLASCRRAHFQTAHHRLYEHAAETLGAVIAERRTRLRLRERIKELTCLHGIAHLAHQSSGTLDEILQAVVRMLPPAWQCPEIAEARIVVDGRPFTTPGFREGVFRQSAAIMVDGRERGTVEVIYKEDRAEFATGPFLPEEQHLIESVAREAALIIERSEADAAQAELQEQVRHADRLATIGTVAAGVAHELNEPLSNVLGFAQLLHKRADLPETARGDLEQIVRASLHGREIIRQLLQFARPAAAVKAAVDLNSVVREGIALLAPRCSSARIDLRLELSQSPLPMHADPAQVRQVVINLAFNAIQAMPEGGRLTIRTEPADGGVRLVVEDTGVGMNRETQQSIFLPFFTTKDVGEGTGLGLAVVHGIITTHGGTIDVVSEPGKGARFTVIFPALSDETEE
jgi:two-component system NtrC family sensor kinase